MREENNAQRLGPTQKYVQNMISTNRFIYGENQKLILSGSGTASDLTSVRHKTTKIRDGIIQQNLVEKFTPDHVPCVLFPLACERFLACPLDKPVP